MAAVPADVVEYNVETVKLLMLSSSWFKNKIWLLLMILLVSAWLLSIWCRNDKALFDVNLQIYTSLQDTDIA